METIQVNLPEDFDTAMIVAIKKRIKSYDDILKSLAVGKLLTSIDFTATNACKVNILEYVNTEETLGIIIDSILNGVYENEDSFKKVYEANLCIETNIESNIDFENNKLDISMCTRYATIASFIYCRERISVPLAGNYPKISLSKKMQFIKSVIKRLQKDINKNYMYTNKDDIFDNFHKASHILNYSDLCDSYVLRKFRCILKEYLNLLSKYEDDEEMLAKIEEEFKKSNITLKFNPEVTRLDATFKYDKDNKPSEITYTVYSMND